jgi:hypothetical protein
MISRTKITLALVFPFGLSAIHANGTLNFPPKGTPYAEARSSFLKQGLAIAPDRVEHPDREFREIDCQHEQNWTGRTWQALPKINCKALFLEKDQRGWRHYVIVIVDPESKTVFDAHYPATAEGHPSIPPPLAADVPQLKGSYFKARTILKSQGFRPAKRHGDFRSNSVCADDHCTNYIALPEVNCSGTGAAFCTAFWIGRNGRVLRVTTIGEHPQVYFVEWSTREELRKELGK